MHNKKIMKLLVLNIAIAVVNIVLFSDGLVGIKIGSSAFQTAFGITAIFMSIATFTYGNYMILYEKKKRISITALNSMEDYINALVQNNDKKTFVNDIVTIIEQIGRFDRKKKAVNEILLQKFDKTEISYLKFHNTVEAIEDVFYLNIRSILNKLNTFDEIEYNKLIKDSNSGKFSRDFVYEKMGIYNEYIEFIKEAIEDNEQVNLKLDRLLLEISKIDSLEDGEIEKMPAMQEIDELIAKVKLYK